MKGSVSRAKLEQMLVVNRKQRALERCKDRQLVVRPFDRGERRADRFDLFPPVKGFAADKQMRDAARFDGVYVRPRDVFAEARESPKQNRDVTRRDRHAPFAAVGAAL